jgi:replication initiation and membrane attachment protein DnaB
LKKRTSYTLSEQAKQLLAKLAEKYSISQTAMLEVLIREKAKQEDVK